MALSSKLEEMEQFGSQIRFMNGNHITYESLINVLEEGAAYMGIPMAYCMDEVKSGGMFNKVKQECLEVYNPEHAKDYYHFCIILSKMGNVAFLDKYIFGRSKMAASAVASLRLSDGMSQGGSGWDVVGGLAGKIFNGRVNQAKMDMESNYYTLVGDIFDTLERVQYDGLKTGFFGTE